MITYVMLCGCRITEDKVKKIQILRPSGQYTPKHGCLKHKQTADYREATCECGELIIAGLSGLVPKQCKACSFETKQKNEATYKQIIKYSKINPRGQYCTKVYACQKKEEKTGKAFICKSCKKFNPVFPGVNPDI